MLEEVGFGIDPFGMNGAGGEGGYGEEEGKASCGFHGMILV